LDRGTSAVSFHIEFIVGTHSDAAAAEVHMSGLRDLADRVQAELRRLQAPLELTTVLFTSKEASDRRPQVGGTLVAIVDATHSDAWMALSVGRLQGAGVPVITVCNDSHMAQLEAMDVSPRDAIRYASLSELFERNSRLEQELLRVIPQSRIHEELIYRFWFPRETGAVWVVCPQIHEPGEYADRGSPDYTYLDNLGDTDALLEVMVFLSQYYPEATIERFSAVDLPRGHTSGNLVIIGGPGTCTDIENSVCAEMMAEINSHVSYSDDCEQMFVRRPDGNIKQLEAQFQTRESTRPSVSDKLLRQDKGYFARFPNPLNENATAVLVNGIHTAGVLGATRAFSERREAFRNFAAVLESRAHHHAFECVFDVQVLNGQVKVPHIAIDDVLPLTRSATLVTVERPPADLVNERRSVRVLFVAGDRGGPRVHQLQTPNEYHAIQEALRGCEFRDVLALANPILAATRERLAEAYRERPAVVHFAGHGNERNLSIIEDKGLIASEAALDATQLASLIRLMGSVRLVVLNACGSDQVARELVTMEAVEYAIGWKGKVSDSAAIAFSRALYGALGDGRTVSDAVELAAQACGPEFTPCLAVARPPAGVLVGEETQQ
jgi:hypothetical protein